MSEGSSNSDTPEEFVVFYETTEGMNRCTFKTDLVGLAEFTHKIKEQGYKKINVYRFVNYHIP